MKKNRRILAVILCATMLLSGCSKSSDTSAVSTGGGSKEPDMEKTYDISYTGHWCKADYEDGSYVERMIEDALNINLTVEKRKRKIRLTFYWLPGRCRIVCGRKRKRQVG